MYIFFKHCTFSYYFSNVCCGLFLKLVYIFVLLFYLFTVLYSCIYFIYLYLSIVLSLSIYWMIHIYLLYDPCSHCLSSVLYVSIWQYLIYLMYYISLYCKYLIYLLCYPSLSIVYPSLSIILFLSIYWTFPRYLLHCLEIYCIILF